jgi:hypothetical protein
MAAEASTLRIELGPSHLLGGLLGAAHALALLAAFISLAGWPLYLVAAAILVSAAALVAESLHGSAGAAVSLEVHADGSAAWRDRRGSWHEAKLGNDHFVSALLMVVRLDAAAMRRKWIVLLPDSAPHDDLRRLRVWLRWRRESGPGKIGEPAKPDQ